MNARDMIPGHTYQGTADGPDNLDGVAFTVLAAASFNPEGGSHVCRMDDDTDTPNMIHVQYDAWGYPFPESQTFAPGDWVIEVPTDGSNQHFCVDCFEVFYDFEPDMGDPVTWKPDICFGCKRDGRTVFALDDDAFDAYRKFNLKSHIARHYHPTT
jgi:hypothetical protein